ncbi:hypothetical protein PR003_g34955, partial [Phytophthora rubi]
EAPLEFFYRLNRVADKAGINFRKSSKERERHFKVFMKKLLDSLLRSTLQGQRLHSLEDLEIVLKQYEEMHQDDDYETPPPRRESRPDYMSAGKFRPKRPAKAYVAQSKVESSSEDEKEVHFQETTEEIPDQGVETGSSESQPPEDWSQVYRAMENAGWKPPPREFRPNDSSPRFGKPPDTSRFC